MFGVKYAVGLVRNQELLPNIVQIVREQARSRGHKGFSPSALPAVSATDKGNIYPILAKSVGESADSGRIRKFI